MSNPNFFWYVLRGDTVLAGCDVRATAAKLCTQPGDRVLHRSELAQQYPQYAAKEDA